MFTPLTLHSHYEVFNGLLKSESEVKIMKNNKPNIRYEIKGQDKTIQKLFGDKKVDNLNPNKIIKNNLGDNK